VEEIEARQGKTFKGIATAVKRVLSRENQKNHTAADEKCMNVKLRLNGTEAEWNIVGY